VSYLKDLYLAKFVPEFKKKHGISNDFMVPAIEKVVLSSCTSVGTHDGKVLKSIVSELETISGQKAVVTRAKESIAAFKIRKGMEIGAKVTIRKIRMYEFLDRLIFMALPRVRDFLGLPNTGFDGRGNYSVGIKEMIVFPEVNFDTSSNKGFGINICTTARDDDVAREMLKCLNFPFVSH
jgi:large subunit ribosomal protein L5